MITKRLMGLGETKFHAHSLFVTLIIATILILFCAESEERASCEANCLDKKNCNKTCRACSEGWYGPYCQHKFAELIVKVDGEERHELTDQNAKTCLKGTNDSLTVYLKYPITTFWVSAKLKDSKRQNTWNHTSMKFKFFGAPESNKLLCSDPPISIVGFNDIEVVCNIQSIVHSITITGKFSRICELYVYVGSNVALKQDTWQSSTMDVWTSNNAVDGSFGPKDDKVGQSKTCTHTYLQKHPIIWKVIFDTPIRVVRVDVYNLVNKKIDCCMQRLKGFSLKFQRGLGQETPLFNHTEPEALPVYTIVPQYTTIDLVKVVEIWASEDTDVMSICEVQVFAQPVSTCELGRYGDNCDKICKCKDNLPCLATGHCPRGCPAGLYGKGCQKSCPHGTYGQDCRRRCPSCNNKQTCDRVTGVCTGGIRLKTCPPDRFGDNCEHLCHCPTNQMCDGRNGTCTRKTPTSPECNEPYHGEGCQLQFVQFKEKELTDGKITMRWLNNRSDCNPQYEIPSELHFQPTVNVRTQRVIICVWKSRRATLDTMKISFREKGQSQYNEKPCGNHLGGVNYTSHFKCREFDCPSISYVTDIRLLGDATMYLCDFLISIGVNMALYAQVELRGPDTTLKVDTGECEDGGMMRSWNRNCCYNSTKIKKLFNATDKVIINKATNLTITFDVPISMDFFIVFGQPDCCWKDTVNFTLTAIDANGEEIYSTKKQKIPSLHEALPSYTVYPEHKILPVSKIVYRSRDETIPVSVCEIQVFGEKLCPRGTFGLGCKMYCNCMYKTICHPITGKCKLGCQVGYTGDTCQKRCSNTTFGMNCSRKCSSNCSPVPSEYKNVHLCNPDDGSCLFGCKVGYTPTGCNKKCQQGRYGENCKTKCSANCLGGCDNINGICVKCKHGYQGVRCDQQCKKGSFGLNCTLGCKRLCGQRGCNHVTGACESCYPGMAGTECLDFCETSLWGQNCSKKCPESCRKPSQCTPVKGACKSCKVGLIGADCSNSCPVGQFGPGCHGVCSDYCSGGLKMCDTGTGMCKYGCSNSRLIPSLCLRIQKKASDPLHITELSVTNRVLIWVSSILLLWMFIELLMEKRIHYQNRQTRRSSRLERLGSLLFGDAFSGVSLELETSNSEVKAKNSLVSVPGEFGGDWGFNDARGIEEPHDDMQAKETNAEGGSVQIPPQSVKRHSRISKKEHGPGAGSSLPEGLARMSAAFRMGLTATASGTDVDGDESFSSSEDEQDSQRRETLIL